MTPSDILRIARAVGPGIEWTIDGVGEDVFDLESGDYFDPLNSNDDAFAVLAWLLAKGLVSVHPLCIEFLLHDFPDVRYDGTEAGLRRAIVEAAGRVVA